LIQTRSIPTPPEPLNPPSLEIAAAHSVQLGDEIGVPYRRVGENRVVEASVDRRSGSRTREDSRQFDDEASRVLRVGSHDREYAGHFDMRGFFTPAIVVRNHAEVGLRKLGLARKLGFGHRRHADYGAPPGSIEIALPPSRKLRSFYREISSAFADG